MPMFSIYGNSCEPQEERYSFVCVENCIDFYNLWMGYKYASPLNTFTKINKSSSISIEF